MASAALIVPSFIAGMLTFLAPCTLPLVPAYLAFIGGVAPSEALDRNASRSIRRKVLANGALFVLGFSAVFIILGVVAGLLGVLFAPYQLWLSRIGGVVVIAFGLFMLGALKIPFLDREFKLRSGANAKSGPWRSLILGASFSMGWTPCVGPILGSVLILAGTSGTALSGAALLTVFSLGLAVPFLAVAYAAGYAEAALARLAPLTRAIGVIGGLFLIGIGFLLITGSMPAFIAAAYRLLNFLHYDSLTQYL